MVWEKKDTPSELIFIVFSLKLPFVAQALGMEIPPSIGMFNYTLCNDH